jgi:hypothetical protein
MLRRQSTVQGVKKSSIYCYSDELNLQFLVRIETVSSVHVAHGFFVM